LIRKIEITVILEIGRREAVYMSLLYNIIIDLYSIMLLIIICISTSKQDDKMSLQYKIYQWVLHITILMLVGDILSRFDGKPDTVFLYINYFGNFVSFLLGPILPSLWLLYVYEQVFQIERIARRISIPLVVLNMVNLIILVLTQFFGWYYYIDSDNIYHRGPFFLLAASYSFGLMLIAFVMIIVNRKRIEKKNFFSLVFFAIPPSLCSILQTLFYGISFTFCGVVASLLIVTLNIKNHSMYTDYLTGVYNRNKLERFLKDKISTSTVEKTFSAIMMDLNNFKAINDTYGHDTGDKALKIFTDLLSSSLNTKDFLARFGGDEFFIVLDASDKLSLESMVRKISKIIDDFNASGEQPFKLDFSMGYEVYDYYSGLEMDEFEKQLDLLMYKNKQESRAV
jgi:diguanylate cyclase (GGDEF)-like protein